MRLKFFITTVLLCGLTATSVPKRLIIILYLLSIKHSADFIYKRQILSGDFSRQMYELKTAFCINFQ
jgi:hypothetical protein